MVGSRYNFYVEHFYGIFENFSDFPIYICQNGLRVGRGDFPQSVGKMCFSSDLPSLHSCPGLISVVENAGVNRIAPIKPVQAMGLLEPPSGCPLGLQRLKKWDFDDSRETACSPFKCSPRHIVRIILDTIEKCPRILGRLIRAMPTTFGVKFPTDLGEFANTVINEVLGMRVEKALFSILL